MELGVKDRGFLCRSLRAAMLAALLVSPVSAVRTEINTIDPVLAATLMLPYFAVDLNDRTRTTLFSVGNISSNPIVAHVVLWTAASIPTLAFDIYLPDFDVKCVDLATIFHDDQSSQMRELSTKGSFPGCSLPTSALTAQTLTDLKNAHTGKPVASFANKCAALNPLDDVARDYLTIDNANDCNLDFPSQDSGTGTVNNNNVLWGDWFIADAATLFPEELNRAVVDAPGLEVTTERG